MFAYGFSMLVVGFGQGTSPLISFTYGVKEFLLICIFALPALFGMTGVWMAAPVTEAVTLVITLAFLKNLFYSIKHIVSFHR